MKRYTSLIIQESAYNDIQQQFSLHTNNKDKIGFKRCEYNMKHPLFNLYIEKGVFELSGHMFVCNSNNAHFKFLVEDVHTIIYDKPKHDNDLFAGMLINLKNGNTILITE